MYLGKNLKYLRIKHGFKQEDIAGMFGYKDYTTVQKWESGVSEPPMRVVRKLSEIYNVKMDDLLNTDMKMEQDTPKSEYYKLPLVGSIAAGKPILALENIVDYLVIDSRLKADFVINVKGDSMINAGILDGDYAFIKQQPEVENGEIAAVLIGDEATLKRFYRHNGSISLIAENPTVVPMTYHNGDISVMGKLVAVLQVRR